jgi:SAM-dependent methyltransferase
MPDAQTLATMYGPDYSKAETDDGTIDDPKQPEKLLAVLRRRTPGCFVDFGCGSGSLLVQARRLGWKALGVEFQSDVVRSVAANTGCDVLLGIDSLRSSLSVPADVLHLGDVVEHLTNPYNILRELVPLLAPGGWLVSQGPLEAGPCLFAATIRIARRLRTAGPVEIPPYHVLQATVQGQRSLFDRVGLRSLEYIVTEVDWPAPTNLSWRTARQPRNLALFLLRRLSRGASVMSGGRFGNRYFYVGEAINLSPATSVERPLFGPQIGCKGPAAH